LEQATLVWGNDAMTLMQMMQVSCIGSIKTGTVFSKMKLYKKLAVMRFAQNRHRSNRYEAIVAPME
jgi:hypothetical protein